MTDNYTAVQRMADAIGFDIAQANSKVQADLFNGLARGLSRIAQPQMVETQNAYIVDDLTAEARTYIVSLAGMCETKS